MKKSATVESGMHIAETCFNLVREGNDLPMLSISEGVHIRNCFTKYLVFLNSMNQVRTDSSSAQAWDRILRRNGVQEHELYGKNLPSNNKYQVLLEEYEKQKNGDLTKSLYQKLAEQGNSD